MAVIFDGGAAARRVDDNGIDAALGDLLAPGIDIGFGRPDCFIFTTDVLAQGAAASGSRRDDDVDAAAREQPDRGVVDFRPQHLLDAAGK